MGSSQSVPAVYDTPARAISILLVVITTTAIIARGASRYMKKTAVGFDDVFAYLGYATNLAQLITCLLLISAGVMSMPALTTSSAEDRAYIAKVFLADGILYILAILTTKLSVLFLIRRIFTMNEKWFRITWWINLLFLFPLWTTAVFALVGWQLENAQLGANEVGRIATPITGALNALSDLAVLLLPLWSIKELKLARKQKLGLGVIFCIGLCGTLTSIVRVIMMTIPQNVTWVRSYGNYTDILLSVAESSACLLCACLLVSRPFLLKINSYATHSITELTSLLFVGSSVRSKRSNSSFRSETVASVRSKATNGGINRTDEVDIESLPLKMIPGQEHHEYGQSGWRVNS